MGSEGHLKNAIMAVMTQQIRCTKAIIAVAGFGTRRLPITKAVEKCMIPVGNRPIVDYVVDDCIQAGITDIIFVVSEQSEQIRTYYGHNQHLEDYLVARHKAEALASISDLAVKARFHFVLQDHKQPYGTSVPVWLAHDYLGPDETFLYLYGDNILYKPDGGSAVADLLEQANKTGAADALLAVEVAPDKVQSYGIIATEEREGTAFFSHIIEKPTPEMAPSNLNNAGCFMVQSAILPYVERSMYQADLTQQEHLFTDALNWYHEDGAQIVVARTTAEYLDCGSVQGWLAANNRIVNA